MVTIEDLEEHGPWKIYTAGNLEMPPVVMVAGLSTTAEAYHKQALFLMARSYSVILVQWGAIWTCEDWVEAFGRLLDELSVDKVHLLGASLGGFLAQAFAARKPHRVLSLFLINTFADTSPFTRLKPVVGFGYLPEFYLKKLVLENFNQQAMDDVKVDAIDFVVEQFEQLKRGEVAARLNLMCTAWDLGPNCLPEGFITVMNSFDTAHNNCKCQLHLYSVYPTARVADIKCGGDFPYLAYAEDVNLHLQVHLRHVGSVPPSVSPVHARGHLPEITEDELPIPVPLELDSEDEGGPQNGIANSQLGTEEEDVCMPCVPCEEQVCMRG